MYEPVLSSVMMQLIIFLALLLNKLIYPGAGDTVTSLTLRNSRIN